MGELLLFAMWFYESHRTYGSSNSNWYVKFQMFMSARAFWRVGYFCCFFLFYYTLAMVSEEKNNRQSCVDIHASVHTGVMVSLSVDWRKHCTKVLKWHVFRKHPYFLPANISITRNNRKSHARIYIA